MEFCLRLCQNAGHKNLIMNTRPPFETLSVLALLALSAPETTRAQVQINASDMFNQPGQYYRAYAGSSDVDVSGRLGGTGGPQAWDFTTGPQDITLRFDYIAIGQADHAADFPGATFAERKTNESDSSTAWMYLEQAAGRGRMNYGFYDLAFSDTLPSCPFTPPIRDFPESIGYGDGWSVATVFLSELRIPDIGDDEGGGEDFVIPLQITYSASAKADAYGIVNQPGIGFGECIRVNELAQWDIAADLGLGDGFQTISTQYTRNYYWLRPGRGIAVQITSKQLDTPPLDEFPVAAEFIRMFETNHPDSVPDTPSIKDFRITVSKDGALLTWTKGTGLTSYQVDVTDNPGLPGSWTKLATTASNYLIDSAANKPGTPRRFYRVVGN